MMDINWKKLKKRLDGLDIDKKEKVYIFYTPAGKSQKRIPIHFEDTMRFFWTLFDHSTKINEVFITNTSDGTVLYEHNPHLKSLEKIPPGDGIVIKTWNKNTVSKKRALLKILISDIACQT